MHFPLSHPFLSLERYYPFLEDSAVNTFSVNLNPLPSSIVAFSTILQGFKNIQALMVFLTQETNKTYCMPCLIV